MKIILKKKKKKKKKKASRMSAIQLGESELLKPVAKVCLKKKKYYLLLLESNHLSFNHYQGFMKSNKSHL